jgi:hypothetical protein
MIAPIKGENNSTITLDPIQLLAE